MNPRERLLKSVNGQEIYPVPTDVITNIIYPNLEQKLIRKTGAKDRKDLLCILNAHMRWANPLYIGPPLEKAPVQPDNTFPLKYAVKNIWGAYSGLNTYSDEFAPRPLANASTTGEVEKYNWPNADLFDYESVIPQLDDPADCLPVSKWADEYKDYARVVGGYDPVFGRICDLCGIQTTLMNLVFEPDMIKAMVNQVTDFLEAYYENVAKAGQGHIDILAFGDDFASQNGMMFNPEQWREYFKPSWKRLFNIAHKYNMKALFHSCGSVRAVMGDLIDVGLDILEVVQISAKDMDPSELKNEFGVDVTFYGTVDVQDVLPNYSPDKVRTEVRRLIDIFGKGGRYILANSHILTEDIPADNVIAMFDEAGKYKTQKLIQNE